MGRRTAGLPIVAGGVVVLLGLVALALPAGAVVDDPDIDTAAEYRYRVDPEAGQVEVTVELTVTADKPNRTTATGYVQYFFDGTVLAIPAEVGALSVTDGAGRNLAFEADDSLPEVTQLEVEFGRNLFYRQTTEVVVTFTLPGGAARGDELTRVNGAYAGFQAWVDPRLEEASLVVITPPGFVDRSTGSPGLGPPVQRDDEDGAELWFEAGDIDPESQWASVSMARDGALVDTDLEVAGHGFRVLSWPGDRAWVGFVTENLETGLPMLIDEVGLDWPLDGELTIIESYDPYLSGYAGWYDLATDEIEIGDQLDTHVMLHELSHVWFNGGLFEERWITEGLADEFGAEVVEATGRDRPEPPRTRLTAPAAFPLNGWSDETDDADRESWGYGASWTVTKALAEEVGLEALAAAVRAAANDEIAYVGDAAPELEPGVDDWRRYLDLIENGAPADAEVAEVFAAWALSDPQAEELEGRAESRARYTALEEAGAGWAAPLAVREAMSDWRFDQADDLMAEATEVLTDRDRTIEVLAELPASLGIATPVSLPADLEEAYERAADDLDGPAELVGRAVEVAEGLAATGRAIDTADGLLERVGAIGADNRADLAQTVARFEDGDLEGAAQRSEALADEVSGLGARGLIRTAVAAVVLVALVGGLGWRRRRRAGRGRNVVVEVTSVLVDPVEVPAGPVVGEEVEAEAEAEAEAPTGPQ